MVVKTAQVRRESKIAREMLRFTIETAVVGREGRRCCTGGCGLCSRYVRISSGEPAMAGVFTGCGEDCRLPDALAGEFTGRGMCGILLGNATADC